MPGSSAKLAAYRKLRNFDQTAEPAGRSAAASARRRRKRLIFVVQEHHATNLHYDFRLELDGVLMSWAVPKGPSLDPGAKRLAVQVEDHPLDYAGFEGEIPKGQYGGGRVIIWDRGTWTTTGDPAVALKSGRLDFELAGRKLRGGWKLIRTRTASGGKVHWLLMKSKDDHARPGDTAEVLAEQPRPARSRCSSQEAKAKPSPVRSQPKPRRKAPAGRGRNDPVQRIIAELADARPGSPPVPFQPELALRTLTTPRGEGWAHEIKFDGYRILARFRGGTISLETRNAKIWNDRLPELLGELSAWGVDDGLLDGELIAMRPDGVSDFQLLQNAFDSDATRQLRYMVFDVPFWNGWDLRDAPLSERRRVLEAVLARHARGSTRVLLSEFISGEGETVIRQACRLKLEGLVSKQLDSPYLSQRTGHWCKTRCWNRQETVIGGFTDPEGTRIGFGALLIGYYQDGQLRYAGKVGTGFDTAGLRTLTERLQKLEIAECPFVTRPTGPGLSRAHWVRPKLVAEVTFSEWTQAGRLRHPVFLGLREDKPAASVVRETARPAPRRATPVTPRAAAKDHRDRGRPSRRAASPVPRLAREAVEVKIGGVTITHPERMVFPEAGLQKKSLAEYYAAISSQIMPHLRARPLSLVRCPAGTTGECFFQKHPDIPDAAGIQSIPITESKGTRHYAAITERRGLLHFVQMNAIEFHTWGARADQPEQPDRLVFDLDPGEGVPWSQLVDAALNIRAVLNELDLEAFVKTSGGKGLHVVTPIKRTITWDQAKTFTHNVAQALAEQHPEYFTASMSKADREGRVFVDYLRNQRGATSVAPYSARARTGAPVSMPVSWKQVATVTAQQFTVQTVPTLIRRRGRDPWEQFDASRRAVPKRVLSTA